MLSLLEVLTLALVVGTLAGFTLAGASGPQR
jgi:hypothetical protein